MEDVEQNINVISDLMKTCPGKKAEHSIYWAKGTKKWKQAGWKNTDRNALKPRLKEIIKTLKPDAIKVIIDPKLARENPQEHIIYVTDVLEEDAPASQQPVQQNQFGQGINGLNGGNGLGALQMENLDKEFTIKLLKRDNEALEDKVASLKEKLKDAEAETDALWLQSEQLSKKGKNEQLLALAGIALGKKFGLEIEPSVLLGLLGDGSDETKPIAEESTVVKTPGIEEDTSNFSEQVNIIALYLTQIEQENTEAFKNIIRILQSFEADPSLIITVLDLLNDNQ